MKRQGRSIAYTALAAVLATGLCVAAGGDAAELDGERLIHADNEPGN